MHWQWQPSAENVISISLVSLIYCTLLYRDLYIEMCKLLAYNRTAVLIGDIANDT